MVLLWAFYRTAKMIDDMIFNFVRSPTLIFLLGIALSYIGYGPLSSKKNPAAGVGLVVIGFLFRLVGPLLLVWDACILLFIISMTR